MTIAAFSLGTYRKLKVLGAAVLAVAAAERLLRAWMARRILARAIAELQAMDDRMLADMGIERSEIEVACRYGRRLADRRRPSRREAARPGWGTRAFTPPTRQVRGSSQAE